MAPPAWWWGNGAAKRYSPPLKKRAHDITISIKNGTKLHVSFRF